MGVFLLHAETVVGTPPRHVSILTGAFLLLPMLFPLGSHPCACRNNCCCLDQAEGATAFVLDTSTITIGTVTVDGERARWVQHRRHSVYGSALDIRLPGAEAGTAYAKGQLLQVRAVDATCLDVM